jgi:tetratricopeptide (TPR) repeat protein
MNAERWQRIEHLFHEASLLPPGRLERWLADTCAGDHELEREVLRLLESDRHSETGVRQLIAEASHDLLTQGVGAEAFRDARIGAWRVDGLLGEGGMGMVFLAHRDDGRFDQTAAIKLLRLPLASPADLARFRREQRILARLGHPHIARLLDAGEHAVGRELEIPYFVMEHVAGTPLTLYAREHRLTSRQRVELYQQVLDAVGYAHQHFVLHRDLKPENILVTADGVVKLLDFGIAQLLEGDPSGLDRTRSTMMTPDYASPEQLCGEPLTVQSDVFTLGALLYELLSGRRAYEAADSASPTERAMTMAAKPAPDLGIDGDLDTIVAKAIHHDLSRRYPSVEALAADLRRYLAGQPVSARRDSGWYRARKFASRRRWPLSAAAVVLATLAAGAVATAYEARRANRHLAQLRQLSGPLLFQVHDAVQSLQGATKARELLATTSAAYLDGLSASAGRDPAVLGDLGAAYERLGRIFGGPNAGHLGRVADSVAAYRKAIDVYRRLETIRPADRAGRQQEARAWVAMGRVQGLSGDHASATASLQTAYEIGRLATAPGEPLVYESTDALLYLGDIATETGKPREALKYYRQALPDIERQATAPSAKLIDHRGLTNTRVRIGEAQVLLGDLAAARDEFQKCVERARAIAAANPDSASVKRDLYLMIDRLATVTGHPDHPNLGDSAAASTLFADAVDRAERLAAADPRDVRARRDLAEMRASHAATLRLSSPARARDEYERVLEIYRTLPESLTKTPNVARWIAEHERGLAVSLAGMSRLDLALPHIEHALSEFRRLDAPRPTGVALTDIAQWRLTTGEIREARRAAEQAVAALERAWTERRDDIGVRRDLSAAYAIMARIVAKTEGCAARRAWVERSRELWHAVAGTEAAPYGQRELTRLATAAPGCG